MQPGNLLRNILAKYLRRGTSLQACVSYIRRPRRRIAAWGTITFPNSAKTLKFVSQSPSAKIQAFELLRSRTSFVNHIANPCLLGFSLNFVKMINQTPSAKVEQRMKVSKRKCATVSDGSALITIFWNWKAWPLHRGNSILRGCQVTLFGAGMFEKRKAEEDCAVPRTAQSTG
jgi:hypothetical protein